MPNQMWKCERCRHATNRAVCTTCGSPGVYDGWHYGMHEAMARYQYETGLKPIGPHRPTADREFADCHVPCANCRGHGLLDSGDDQYALCAQCEGMGSFWKIAPDEVEAIRRRILAQYPEAAAPRGPTRFDRPPIVLDLSRGEIID